jgi:hypothetical protein
LLLEAGVGSTDTFSAKQSVAITDVKQTIQSFYSQTAQFSPFGAIDNQPYSRNNNPFECNNSSLETEQCIRQFDRFVNGSSCATNVVATAAERERGPSVHDDQVVVLSFDDITVQDASFASSLYYPPTNILLSASTVTSVSEGDVNSSSIGLRLHHDVIADRKVSPYPLWIPLLPQLQLQSPREMSRELRLTLQLLNDDKLRSTWWILSNAK